MMVSLGSVGMVSFVTLSILVTTIPSATRCPHTGVATPPASVYGLRRFKWQVEVQVEVEVHRIGVRQVLLPECGEVHRTGVRGCQGLEVLCPFVTAGKPLRHLHRQAPTGGKAVQLAGVGNLLALNACHLTLDDPHAVALRCPCFGNSVGHVLVAEDRLKSCGRNRRCWCAQPRPRTR